MWSVPVEILLPLFNCFANVVHCAKQSFIEAFISQLAIEVFDKAVLLGCPRCDVMPVDAYILNPFDDRHAGKLSTVVRHDCFWHATFSNHPVQLSGNTPTRLWSIRNLHQVLTTEVVNNRQNAKNAARLSVHQIRILSYNAFLGRLVAPLACASPRHTCVHLYDLPAASLRGRCASLSCGSPQSLSAQSSHEFTAPKLTSFSANTLDCITLLSVITTARQLPHRRPINLQGNPRPSLAYLMGVSIKWATAFSFLTGIIIFLVNVSKHRVV